MTETLQNTFIDRRGFLKGMTALVAAGSMARPLAAAEPAGKKRALRLAHLTDVHVQPEQRASEGLVACLRHVQSQSDKPELILIGGDSVMDSFGQTRTRTQLQWDLWKRVLKAECSLPIEPCLGNHDIWGWSKSKSKATGQEPDYGKKFGMEAYGLSNRYRSFEKNGWKFLALDGVQPGAKPESYSAYLDEEQFDWLKRELESTPATTPILVWSHVPIISTWPVIRKRQTPTSDITVSSGVLHTDSKKLIDLFSSRPAVKVCLSGHLHLDDSVRVKGVDFHCNGAVSGNWWKGKFEGIPEGYAVVDLFDDGSHERQYIPYGWQAT
jgi:3',5'-cyclic AMP phosphodiesterase CpdA